MVRLQQFEKKTGKKHPDLELVEIDPDSKYLWDWYQELARARPSGMGAEALRWSEIDAWARMTKRNPEPWEIDVVVAIDSAFLEFMAEKRKNSRPTTTKPAPSPKGKR